jgi:hypothetical protein
LIWIIGSADRNYSIPGPSVHFDIPDPFKASIGDPDTLSYDEAMADKVHVDDWRSAARKEIEILESHGTWEVDDISAAKSKILPGIWVFKVKRSPDGTVIKRKARYCVRGYSQEDQRETFAPVFAWSTVRLFLVLAMLLEWATNQCGYIFQEDCKQQRERTEGARKCL